MKEIQKPVRRSSLVILSLFAAAVAGSGVAQAQQCFARRASGSPNAVRAEGMTELLGGIELLCTGGAGTGFTPPETIEISIELNTAITNETNDDDMVQGLTYTFPGGGADLGAEADYEGEDREVLSDDGMAITWEIASSDLGIAQRSDDGGTVTIGGIMADASAVGNGEDITATVTVSGVAASGSPVKLADVTTGLDITVTAASGLQCEAPSAPNMAVATIKFVEGFNSAIRAVADDAQTADVDESARNSVLVLNFRGIPDGVTVMASLMGTGEALEDDMTDLAPLMLKTGETEGADDDGMVGLSSGAGHVIYNFDTSSYDHDDDGNTDVIPQVNDGTKEWNEVEITFTWGAGAPPIGSGSVTVSYHPVTDDMDKRPRFVAGPTNMVVTINACATTLLFPFVFHQSGFDTGIAISNTSPESGSCTINYHGAGGPDPHESPLIAGGGQLIFTLSSTVDTTGFRGYLVAVCDFRKAYGFAIMLDGFGEIDSTLAMGYLAVRNPWNK